MFLFVAKYTGMHHKNPFFSLVMAITSFICFVSCNGDQEEKNNGIKKTGTRQEDQFSPGKDSLSDAPQFVFELDEREFSVSPENITVTYISSDSIINIYAKTGDTTGLFLCIPCKMERPFTVSTGYSSEKTKIAFSEELAVVPTVILNNYPEVDISFNNLDDGYHKKEIQPSALTVTAFNEIKNETGSSEKSYILKGYIHTRLLKNVFAAKANDDNHDYRLNGKFVVVFRSYW